MASSPSPSLQSKSDFAAELVLNRIMNGQLESNNGKTINAANRSMAMRHDATAQTYNVLAENIAVGKAVVDETQNALTELLDHVKKIREYCSSVDNDATAQRIASEMLPNLDALLDTEAQILPHNPNTPSSAPPNNTPAKVLGNTGFDLKIGENEILTIAKANIWDTSGNSTPTGSQFEALYSSLSSGTATASDIVSKCDAAIDELMSKVADQGVLWKELNNRYEMYNSLAETYHEASDAQGVSTSSTHVVLNTFL